MDGEESCSIGIRCSAVEIHTRSSEMISDVSCDL